jgi:two-component system, LytTR family, response regulator LytT
MSVGLAVLAVDDELPALRDLARLLRSSPAVDTVDIAAGSGEAIAKIAQQTYDAIFLDVRMPEVDGLEFARIVGRFANPPFVVFVTAYEDAAIDAFQMRALDYLLKPVARRRLDETLARVQAAASESEARPGRDTGHGDIIAAQNLRGGALRLVRRSAVLYVEASEDYVRLVCDDGRFLLRGTLLDFERRWEQHGFVRVHRRYLANLGRAVEVRPQLNGAASLLFPNDVSIPISRRRLGELVRRLGM